MSWNYRIMRHTKDREEWYELHEMFYGIECGNVWTESGVVPFGDTREELIMCIEMMLSDAKRAPVVDYHTGEEISE